MNDELQKKVADAIRDPQNIGEMPDADSVGTVGNSECGEMLRMWVKYKEQDGEKVIDKASFQSFGCETAIAVASLATLGIAARTAWQTARLVAVLDRALTHVTSAAGFVRIPVQHEPEPLTPTAKTTASEMGR